MLRFLLRRLLVAVPTLLLVVTASFFMMRAAPGGPFDMARRLPPQVEHNLEAKYGLDKPLAQQYLTYLGGVLHGDFGPSLKYQDKTVLDIVAENFPVSLRLGLASLVIGVVFGVAFGVAAALKRNSAIDYSLTTLAIVGVCVPSFVTAPLLVLLFATTLGWFPTGGASELASYVLPVLTLALPQIAVISRLTRAGMVEVLHANYIRTARAKGLSESRIVLAHALRAAILPLVGYLGPATAGVVTGSLVVEKIFGLPGLGKFFVLSALQRDYTVVMGVVILYAVLVIALNLAAEVAQALLDPRMRLS
ncbi:MAG: ABC transporter permease subunit [Caulobacteraceae bacterium]|nr:ABC transporter permease subunit [Caulobacteraceae bacterium]